MQTSIWRSGPSNRPGLKIRASRFRIASITMMVLAAPAAWADVSVNSPAVDPGAALPLSGPHVVISSDQGLLRGNNLFHSFEQFTLEQGESATWSSNGLDAEGNAVAGGSVQNLINRVTGGSGSIINGRIDSTAYPNADFYFVDPNGVTLGPDAQIDVPGALHITTADEVELEDGNRFSAPAASTLTSAPPAAFGFSSTAPAPISATGTQLNRNDDTVFAGGNITILGNTIDVTNGNLSMTSMAGPGSVAVDGSVSDNQSASGEIDISQTQVITTRADPNDTAALSLSGGPVSLSQTSLLISDDITVQADEFTLDQSFLVAEARADLPTTDRAPNVDIAVKGDMDVSLSNIVSQNASGATNPGRITIQTGGTLNITEGFVNADTTSAGPASAILISARTLDMAGGLIVSGSFNAGSPSNVTITAQDNILINRRDFSDLGFTPSTLIDAVSFEDAERSGTVTLIAGDRFEAGPEVTISSQSRGEGNAGEVLIHGENLLLLDGTLVSTRSGLVASVAGQIALSTEGALILQGATIDSLTATNGNAGQIILDAQTITTSGGVSISSASDANGNAGQVIILADGAIDFAQTDITTRSGTNDSQGGFIFITAQGAIAASDTVIDSQTASRGSAGEIAIEAESFSLSGAATGEVITGVISTASVGEGDAGRILIITDTGINFTNAAITTEAGTQESNAGAILIGTQGAFSASNTTIQSTTAAQGDGGTIGIEAQSITVTGGLGIATESFGSGNAGNIELQADGDIVLEDARIRSAAGLVPGSAGGAISITSLMGSLHLRNSLISSVSAEDTAGAITLSAETLIGEDASLINSATQVGQGGDVTITAESLLLTGASGVRASVINEDNRTPDTGRAGNVSINTNELTLSDGSFISSGGDNGAQGGEITIDPREIGDFNSVTISGESEITTESETGLAGAIRITANDRLDVFDQGRISASVSDPLNEPGSGQAGDLFLRGGDITISSGGVILTSAIGDGEAGNINLIADNLSILSGGQLSAITFGPGSAGNQTILITGRLLIDSSGGSQAAGATGIGSLSQPIPPNPDFPSNADAEDISFGDAGAILISAETVDIFGAGRISSRSFAEGNAGFVSVRALESITVDGFDAQAEFLPAITSATAPGTNRPLGNAGIVTVNAPRIALRNGATISTASFGGFGLVEEDIATPPALIVIDSTQSLILENEATINSATFGSQQGGAVIINVPEISLAGNSTIVTSTFGPADAGGIFVGDFAPIETLNLNNSQILSRSSGLEDAVTSAVDLELTSRAGLITLRSNGGSLSMQNDSLISTEAATGGIGGNILIGSGQRVDIFQNPDGTQLITPRDADAFSTLIMDGSRIETRAQINDGGDIQVIVSDTIRLTNSFIVSEVAATVDLGGIDPILLVGAGGDIIIDPLFTLVNGSQIDSSSQFGNGGDVFVASDFILFVNSLFDLDGGTAQGNLTLNSALLDVSGDLAALTTTIGDITRVLPERCELRQGEIPGTLTELGVPRRRFGAGGPLLWQPVRDAPELRPLRSPCGAH